MIARGMLSMTKSQINSNASTKFYAPNLLVRSKMQTSPVYETYWRFAAERQEIFFKRLAGHQEPWTNDEILSRSKFTNAYRASDRVSQFLISDVIYGGTYSETECFFRILLFKLFNKIETWTALKDALGEPSWKSYDFAKYDKVLMKAIESKKCIYSAAYIMPSGTSSFGSPRKHRNHLRLLESMMKNGLPLTLSKTKTMEKAFQAFLSYPTIGAFLAYQYVIDVNYSTLTDFDENEFVVPGPGAHHGIRKCFLELGGYSEAEIISLMMERQTQEFERLGIKFQNLFGRDLTLIDCQNLFCEVDKYARIAHPEYNSLTGKTRIKQIFRVNQNPICYKYPPKWGISSSQSAKGIPAHHHAGETPHGSQHLSAKGEADGTKKR